MNGMMDGSWGLNALCQEELDEALLNSEREERLEKERAGKWGWLWGSSVAVVAYPCQTDEGTPEETMLALFPDGYTDRGVRGQPIHTDEDVRGREVETQACQGLGGCRTRICGHWETRTKNFEFHLFFWF